MQLPGESLLKRWLFVALALSVAGAFLHVIVSYGAFVSPVIDQNGYQVGGKVFAKTLTAGVKPTNEYQYVGWLWVLTPEGWYYPKYPVGLPMLNAALITLGGPDRGADWALMLSPVCSALSLVAIFFMIRAVAGSFAAILGELLLACNPVMLVLAGNANSHPPALFFVTAGMMCLILWWKHGGLLAGVLAGFLLGYTTTIRYSEGLLALPIGVAMLCTVRWREPKTILSTLPPFIGWCIPIVFLALYNKLAMGTWTGYDTTNESTGFGMDKFQEKWRFMVSQLHDLGMFFVLPISLMALAMMFRKSWRLATLVALWFFPPTFLYTCYYWGNGWSGIGYLRFFLTLFPPLIFCTAWLIAQACRPGSRAIAAPFAAGLFVALTCLYNVSTNVGALERDFTINSNTFNSIKRVKAAEQRRPKDLPAAAETSLLFGAQRQFINTAQSYLDMECYTTESMGRHSGRWGGGGDPNAPDPLQPARREHWRKFTEGKSDADLVNDVIGIITDALKDNRRVFVCMNLDDAAQFRGRYVRGDLQYVRLERWKDPVPMSEAGRKSMNNLGPAGAMWMGLTSMRSWELGEVKLKPQTQPPPKPPEPTTQEVPQ